MENLQQVSSSLATLSNFPERTESPRGFGVLRRFHSCLDRSQSGRGLPQSKTQARPSAPLCGATRIKLALPRFFCWYDIYTQEHIIRVFYDTSTLRHNHWGYHADLTTDYGKRWFYATVRDFFSCIPAKHWAMIDGKPIVLLYASAFAKKWDQEFI